MPQKLTERPEEKFRQFIVDTIDPVDIHGYDPTQTDPTETDFIPVTSDWSSRGEHYPLIYIGEDSGPSVPNSGNTNSNGLQGDGSGINQTAVHTITISVQVTEGGAYLNGVDYDVLAQDIYTEIRHELQKAAPDAVSEGLYTGIPTPPTFTRDPGETDSSTEGWMQAQGTVPYGVLYEP